MCDRMFALIPIHNSSRSSHTLQSHRSDELTKQHKSMSLGVIFLCIFSLGIFCVCVRSFSSQPFSGNIFHLDAFQIMSNIRGGFVDSTDIKTKSNHSLAILFVCVCVYFSLFLSHFVWFVFSLWLFIYYVYFGVGCLLGIAQHWPIVFCASQTASQKTFYLNVCVMWFEFSIFSLYSGMCECVYMFFFLFCSRFFHQPIAVCSAFFSHVQPEKKKTVHLVFVIYNHAVCISINSNKEE